MSEDERAIREIIGKWMAASKAGDSATVLSLMADDVVFMVAGQKPFGKEAFADKSDEMKNVLIEGNADVQEVEVLGTRAWCRTHLTVTVTPPKGKAMRRSGYTLTIFRKEPGGRWVLYRDANLLMPE
jgi:uncharacterized protein (TIGR02246 family)